MRRCCFLTTDDLTGQILDDDLTFEPLKELGWDVSVVSWRARDIEWNEFDAVVIRTTWDYHNDPLKFLKTLRQIKARGPRLFNPLDLVEWNLEKTYLAELGSHGVAIVPTLYCDEGLGPKQIDEFCQALESDEMVIKPQIGANSDHAYRVTEYQSQLAEVFAKRPYLVQPFMPNINSEGEYSLFHFGGRFSHAVLKTPAAGDFRVQQEHGGAIRPVEATPGMLMGAEAAISYFEKPPLYARTDLVRDVEDNFLLMELELIEPSLYFRCDPAAAGRFASAFAERMNES
ncbi:MAG: hypothetical protein ABI539_02870 [Acidobacteriota bacterium]